MRRSRSRLAPYALAVSVLAVSSACPVKLVYVMPFEYGAIFRKLSRTQAMFAVVSPGFSQLPSIDAIHGADRSAQAVSVGPTRLIAPPIWKVATSVSGEGRCLARSAMTARA